MAKAEKPETENSEAPNDAANNMSEAPNDALDAANNDAPQTDPAANNDAPKPIATERPEPFLVVKCYVNRIQGDEVKLLGLVDESIQAPRQLHPTEANAELLLHVGNPDVAQKLAKDKTVYLALFDFEG